MRNEPLKAKIAEHIENAYAELNAAQSVQAITLKVYNRMLKEDIPYAKETLLFEKVESKAKSHAKKNKLNEKIIENVRQGEIFGSVEDSYVSYDGIVTPAHLINVAQVDRVLDESADNVEKITSGDNDLRTGLLPVRAVMVKEGVNYGDALAILTHAVAGDL